ncbi:MAG: hypothetical protein H6914_09740 [Novosphingobium sp.]|nr:hypothetical protein [Novosphingobium sp.]
MLATIATIFLCGRLQPQPSPASHPVRSSMHGGRMRLLPELERSTQRCSQAKCPARLR